MQLSSGDLLAAFSGAISDDLAQLAALHSREAGEALLSGLRVVGFPENLGLAPGSQRCKEAHGMMKAAVTAISDPMERNTLDDLAADYADIYLNQVLRASPYESVWLDDERLMRQEPMFRVREWYRRYGLVAGDWRRTPDDHIALQLQFVSMLLASNTRDNRDDVTQDVTRESIADAALFMDEHLLVWLPDFSQRVVQRCGTPFYAAAAALTDAYVDELRDHFAVILEAPRPEPAKPSDVKPAADCDIQAYVPGAAPSW